jgi:hypothetical protein
MGYDQTTWVNPCGSPACALGHYAAQYPKRFVLNPNWVSPITGLTRAVIHLRSSENSVLSPTSSIVTEEFQITESESEELFNGGGCGEAKTAKEAAAYIRKFVRRKDRLQAKKRAKRKARR